MGTKNKIKVRGVTINKEFFTGKSEAEVKKIAQEQGIFEHLPEDQKLQAENELHPEIQKVLAKDAADAQVEKEKEVATKTPEKPAGPAAMTKATSVTVQK